MKQEKMFTSEQMTGSGQLNMLDQIERTEDRISELRRTVHKFWNDPGHGWLEVQRRDLILLKIANKISGYSYSNPDGKSVYLEEDCDASKYIEALWCNMLESAEFQYFRETCFKDEYREHIFIRALPHYKP